MLNNFWTPVSIPLKFSGHNRLVAANLWVGSTIAQFPPGRTWPGSSPFPWSLSSQWSLELLGNVIPFWKAFDKPTKCESRFLMLGLSLHWWVTREIIFFWELDNFLKNSFNSWGFSAPFQVGCVFISFCGWGPVIDVFRGWAALCPLFGVGGGIATPFLWFLGVVCPLFRVRGFLAFLVGFSGLH